MIAKGGFANNKFVCGDLTIIKLHQSMRMDRFLCRTLRPQSTPDRPVIDQKFRIVDQADTSPTIPTPYRLPECLTDALEFLKSRKHSLYVLGQSPKLFTASR